MSSKEESSQAIDEILNAVIDDWYERVSGYYVTQETLDEDPQLEVEVELKKFHDAKGHRIKFNKDELDFTYGLRSGWKGDRFEIEVSVNNKVPNFDYDDFRTQLSAHYDEASTRVVTRPAKLGRPKYGALFHMEDGVAKAFQVERSSGKAEIMRLSFEIGADALEKMTGNPDAAKQLVESYCVSPFRSTYAKVYRSSTPSR